MATMSIFTEPLPARPFEAADANSPSGPASSFSSTSATTDNDHDGHDITMGRTTTTITAAAATAAALPHGFKWTPQDVFCSSLFGPWDDLPTRNYRGHTPLLRDLDRIITLFDARIQHSDAGFRAWRDRHKQAMEAGLAPIPGFPALRRRQRLVHGRGGAGPVDAWQDDRWEQRYHYLIYQRQRMILARLDGRFMLSRRERDDFFGRLHAPSRETLRGRPRGPHSQPLILRNEWYMPLEYLLERAAREWNMDTAEVKSQFWRDKVPLAEAAAVPNTGGANEVADDDDVEPPARRGETDREERKAEGKAKGKSKTSCGKMDLEYLLADPSQLARGSRAPQVSLESQMSW